MGSKKGWNLGQLIEDSFNHGESAVLTEFKGYYSIHTTEMANQHVVAEKTLAKKILKQTTIFSFFAAV